MAQVQPDAPPAFYTVSGAAHAFQCTTRTIDRWIKSGQLPAYRVGPRMVRIKRADIEALLVPIEIEDGAA